MNQFRELWLGSPQASVAAILNSPLAEQLGEVDAVVINGEGTIHHDGGRHLLMILAAAQELKIPTFLVNSVLQGLDTGFDVLQRLDDLTVRDQRTADYLTELKIPHRLVMDSILHARFAATPDRDFSGKVVITDHHSSRDADVGEWIRSLRSELGESAVLYPFYHKDRFHDWSHAVANLSTAKLVITARHHGVYVAGLAGIPFVALGSNTWKIEGTLAMFNNRIPICSSERQLREAVRLAVSNPGLYHEFREFLLSQCPLTTLDRFSQQFQPNRANTTL
ncbi:MAG TPA: polysaccharide pyruvyl transferase family protein [Verrucomicrobiae bacterium]|nr:polysaccharide pyruvyl transferase family protein [Verrucomicrobiae bacterium]